MKAVGSRILVKEASTTTEKLKVGNFEVPVTDYEKVEILSVGEEIKSLQEGDIALIYPGAGKEFMYDGQKYRVISINEVIVVI
jgi:co-chaperonin GroES (HSP10)